MRVFLLLIIICSFTLFVKAQEVEIIQKISKQQPILFIDADNKKVVHVKFPLCINTYSGAYPFTFRQPIKHKNSL